jgi:hypothetical protein
MKRLIPIAILAFLLGAGLTFARPREVQRAAEVSRRAAAYAQSVPDRSTTAEACCPPAPIGTEGPETR